MKKFFLVAFVATASLVSANCSEVENKIKGIDKPSPDYDYEYGMGAIQTANGTCFVYGTYVYLKSDHNYYTFTPAQPGTYVGMEPTCTGAGTGMA